MTSTARRSQSLAFLTERMILEFDGEVYDRHDYWVGRSPRAPLYYWGNLLVFDSPPGRWARHEWTAAFRREFADCPTTEHMSFGWDSTDGSMGEVAAFEEVGFTSFSCDVLTGDTIHRPPRAAEDVVVRAVTTDSEYSKVEQMQMVTKPDGMADEVYIPFVADRVAGMRRWADAGFGPVLAAFLDGPDGEEMAACLSIFVRDGIARYQSVVTAPAFRRRGIAGRLVADAGQIALSDFGASQLVITSDSGSSASKIYASTGLVHVQQQVGMLRRPPDRVTESEGRVP